MAASRDSSWIGFRCCLGSGGLSSTTFVYDGGASEGVGAVRDGRDDDSFVPLVGTSPPQTCTLDLISSEDISVHRRVAIPFTQVKESEIALLTVSAKSKL